MATSNGIIRIKRTIGGITFYMRKGKPCERAANGPSKQKIARSVRESGKIMQSLKELLLPAK